MASPIIDPLITVKPSERLLKVVPYLLKSEHIQENEDSKTILPAGISLVHACSGNIPTDLSFSVEDIKWVYDRKELLKEIQLCESDKEIDWIRNIHFHELLSECEMILPQPTFPPRDPVLEARCQKLKAQQEEREYRRMTSNIDNRIQGLHKHSDHDSISQQMKEINNYLLIVAQLVISLVCSFAFGYLAPFYFYQVTEVGPRLLCGIIFAFVVGLADLYFVIKFFLETEGVIEGDTIKSYDASAGRRNQRKIKAN